MDIARQKGGKIDNSISIFRGTLAAQCHAISYMRQHFSSFD